ncbi:MAG: hypothetical protein WHT09_16845 [Thermogutta sp.]
MTRSIAYPFLTLPPEAVTAGRWRAKLNESQETKLEDYLERWDYRAAVELTRSLDIDCECACDALQIPSSDLRLAVAVRVGTGGSQSPRAIVTSQIFELGWDSGPADIRLHLDSSRLSQTLHLETAIILARASSSVCAFSPKDSGDRLWSDRYKVRLEGPEPRFPIEEASLNDEATPWKVVWNPGDWSRDFRSAVRIRLNRRNRDIMERLKANDELAFQAMLADTLSQLMERFLRDEETESQFPEGSLGDVVMNWISILFPTGNRHAARELLLHDPGSLREQIWSLAKTEER